MTLHVSIIILVNKYKYDICIIFIAARSFHHNLKQLSLLFLAMTAHIIMWFNPLTIQPQLSFLRLPSTRSPLVLTPDPLSPHEGWGGD